MKTNIFLIVMLFIFSGLPIAESQACQLSIPESYIPTFLNPPVSGAYETCESRPKEECFCIEKVDPWTSNFGTVFTTDPETGINIEKKEFFLSDIKKEAMEIAKASQEAEIKTQENKKKQAIEALKSVDIEGATTVAKLKTIIKLLLEAK